MKKRMLTRAEKRFVASIDEKPKSTMIESDSLKQALVLALKGDSIYKLVKVGRVDKDGKYRTIKRKKK